MATEHIFDISAKIIDTGEVDSATTPINRMTQELTELDTDVAVVESFSHSILFRTPEGLVVFDSSGLHSGQAVVDAIRTWSPDAFHTLVYTHGHMDHIGGSPAFAQDAADKGVHLQVVGHEAVIDRMRRYDMTDGYNFRINRRQFAGVRALYGLAIDDDQKPERFIPRNTVYPNHTYSKRTSLSVGGLEMQLIHARGETDDHTWTWIPEKKAICAGDLFLWYFPNCGNPQKAQRYPKEWAQAMRDMISYEPEVLLPAHGLAIQGKERIRKVLNDVASVLEQLVQDTLNMMNEGAVLDDLIHNVRAPEAELAKPWLIPFHDEPEFVVRNLWRLYGGWYDGNPANLKPAPDAVLAKEITSLAGGSAKLIQRAQDLADAGNFRLACHLIEMASKADDSPEAHRVRADIYQRRLGSETSLMAKGIFGSAASASTAKTGDV